MRFILLLLLALASSGLRADDAPPVHVGLYDGNQPDYAEVLRVVRPGTRWSLDELVKLNAFGGGKHNFGTWYQGPNPREFTDGNGRVLLMYKVRITDPRGHVRTFGPYGFTTRGFATYFVPDVQIGIPGTWKVDWLTVHRDTAAEVVVQSDAFEMAP